MVESRAERGSQPKRWFYLSAGRWSLVEIRLAVWRSRASNQIFRRI